MPKEFCQIIISAVNRNEADRISDRLLKKRLIAGSLIINGPCKFWWKGKIVNTTYHNVQAFSLFKHKTSIISEIEKMHQDETPLISFTNIEGNHKFLEWIKESVK